MKKYLLATLFAAAFALCGAKVQAQNYIVVDSEKILPSIKKVLFTPRELDGIISNYVFSDEVKALYPRTEFIETKPMDY